MYEPRCALCGVRCRSAGQTPPPSWWVDPLEPSLCLCEDCRTTAPRTLRQRKLGGDMQSLERLKALYGPKATIGQVIRDLEGQDG